jgi:hypothetical protein
VRDLRDPQELGLELLRVATTATLAVKGTKKKRRSLAWLYDNNAMRVRNFGRSRARETGV